MICLNNKFRTGLRHFFYNLILIFIFPEIIYSQPKNLEQKAIEKYVPGQPYQAKLRFQKIIKDFIIFYDDQHQLYYLKYRINRWDYTNDEKIKDLHASIEYNVEFKFVGSTQSEEDIFAKSEGIAKSSRDRQVREIRKIYSGEYKGHQNSQVELIRY